MGESETPENRKQCCYVDAACESLNGGGYVKQRRGTHDLTGLKFRDGSVPKLAAKTRGVFLKQCGDFGVIPKVQNDCVTEMATHAMPAEEYNVWYVLNCDPFLDA